MLLQKVHVKLKNLLISVQTFENIQNSKFQTIELGFLPLNHWESKISKTELYKASWLKVFNDLHFGDNTGFAPFF